MNTAMKLILISTVWTLIAASPVAAEQIKHFEGVVESVSLEAVIVRSGSQVMEFESHKKLTALKPGDHISITYTITVHAITVHEDGQKPGEFGPEVEPGKESPIIDDRLFYDANIGKRDPELSKASQQPAGTWVARSGYVEPNIFREGT